MIKENIDQLQKEIRRIAEECGRITNAPQLIAVSKTVDVSFMEEAADCGIMDFGENRVQELVEKYSHFEGKLPEGFRWHQIGRLQTNKVKYLIGKNILIHSLDRFELAEEISVRSVRAGVETETLVQVNVSGEESKAGISLEEVESFLWKVSELPGLRVLGLMTVAPHTEDEALIRQVFSKLREIFVDMGNKKIHNRVEMKYLSMGMSNDFRIAIEEGANLLRIGTAIFGRR